MPNSVAQGLARNQVLEEVFRIGEKGPSRKALSPSDISEDPCGNLYVVDDLAHRIAKYSANGVAIGTIGEKGTEPGQFRYPTSIRLLRNGHIVVSDRWNHRVQVLDDTGNPVRTFGKYGRASGSFSEPWGLEVTQSEEIIVMDRGNHRVQVFSSDGTFLRQFGKAGFDRKYYESGDFKAGFVFGRWTQSINRFLPIETSFHDGGYEVGSLEFPLWANRLDSSRLIISDTSGKISLVDSSGSYLEEYLIGSLPSPGGFTPTCAAALDSERLLACDECTSELLVFDMNTRQSTPVHGLESPVTNLRRLPSGRIALVHGWDSTIAICEPVPPTDTSCWDTSAVSN